jgi:heat shock protein HslJ
VFVALQEIPAAAALLILAVSLGCGEMGATPGSVPEIAGRENAVPSNESPLADTEWRLMEIKSMDDAVGVVRPEDASLYTMHLNADDTVHMRLNCNRATGSWTAEPSADPSNGRVRFGLLASAKALCPPPSLDEKIVADAKYVRGYLLRDNRLYLSLYADGGIHAWGPNSEARFSGEPNTAIEKAILQAAPDYTRAVAEIGGASSRGTLSSTAFPSAACRSSYRLTKPTAGITLSDRNLAEEAVDETVQNIRDEREKLTGRRTCD